MWKFLFLCTCTRVTPPIKTSSEIHWWKTNFFPSIETENKAVVSIFSWYVTFVGENQRKNHSIRADISIMLSKQQLQQTGSVSLRIKTSLVFIMEFIYLGVTICGHLVQKWRLLSWF